MSVYVDREAFDAAFHGPPLSEDEWARIDGLLRRAERELALIVGPLERYAPGLVADVLIDAVIESGLVDNPQHYRSETDGEYNYTRFTLSSGRRSRFWWPHNLRDLFGLPELRGKIRVHRIGPSCASRGWVG